MTDIPTVLVLGALASKDLVLKLLGPTADYLGESGRDAVKKMTENFERVLSIACSKQGRNLNAPGQVNARVLKGVWDEFH